MTGEKKDEKDETIIAGDDAGSDAGKAGDDDLAKLKRHNAALLTELNNKKSTLKEQSEKLSAYEKAEADKAIAEAKKNGDLEKLVTTKTQEAEQKITRMKERLIRSELKSAAAAAGIIDSDLVSMIETDKVTVSDDYEVDGIAVAVENFKKKKPNLFKDLDADAAAAKAAEEAEKNKSKTTGASVLDPAAAGKVKSADGVKAGTKEAKQVLQEFQDRWRK